MKRFLEYIAAGGWLLSFVLCVCLVILSIIHVDQLNDAQAEVLVLKSKLEVEKRDNQARFQAIKKEISIVNHNIAKAVNHVVSVEQKMTKFINTRDLYEQVEEALRIKR